MIDREDLLDLITTEDIINIMFDLGTDTYKIDNQGNIYFKSICHNSDNHKLYYFSQYKIFKCFTHCGAMSLYDLIMIVKDIDFKSAFEYLCNYKGISIIKTLKKGLQKTIEENKDLDFLKLHLYKKQKQVISLPHYDRNIIKIFDNYLPLSWYKEGITDDIADLYDIKFYISQNKAIIPHYDILGNLVGIRGRSFNKIDLDNKRKYMPITIQGLTYRYPMNFNLYGIYQNQNNIRKIKKAIIVEGEKSVLLYGSYFGQVNNIMVATSGMTVSLYQRDLLISLGIEEIIIAYDKQYQCELFENEIIDEDAKREFNDYIKRLIKISNMFMDYCNVSIITCWDDRLDYKDSPIDKGQEVFNELFKERYLITDIEELKEMLI